MSTRLASLMVALQLLAPAVPAIASEPTSQAGCTAGEGYLKLLRLNLIGAEDATDWSSFKVFVLQEASRSEDKAVASREESVYWDGFVSKFEYDLDDRHWLVPYLYWTRDSPVLGEVTIDEITKCERRWLKSDRCAGVFHLEVRLERSQLALEAPGLKKEASIEGITVAPSPDLFRQRDQLTRIAPDEPADCPLRIALDPKVLVMFKLSTGPRVEIPKARLNEPISVKELVQTLSSEKGGEDERTFIEAAFAGAKEVVFTKTPIRGGS